MPSRPPKEWFYYVVGELEKNPAVNDPKALASWLWNNFMKPETKRQILRMKAGTLKKAKALYKEHGLDPEEPLKVRVSISSKMPKVQAHRDYKTGGLIRVLKRTRDFFPEFALYAPREFYQVTYALEDAGFTQEEKGKWVLRTTKFNIFVYV